MYHFNCYIFSVVFLTFTIQFEQTTVNRISASTWSANMASIRVLEKAGLRFEGLARQRRFANGAFCDVKFYAMLREDVFAEKGPPL